MKIIIIAASVLILAFIGFYLFVQISKPKKADFARRTEPALAEKADVPVLRVDFEGDADVVISAAYKDLFKTYYKCKGVPKGPKQAPTLARYENFADMVLETEEKDMKSFPWKGYVALPVPAGTVLPGNAPPSVTLETLDYGQVAELVHFGPYEEEHVNIRKLHDFIESRGYEISGLHEEEYILGPGVPFTSKKDYITVIRYQVRKKD